VSPGPGEAPRPSLSRRTATAASWRTASSAVVAALSFGISIWLARLLPPSDFGLVAMAFLFTGLTRIVSNLGIPSAVVQRPDLTDDQVRTAFTLSTVLGLGATILLVVLAPLSTLVFPEPRVPDVLRAVAPMFLFTGLGNVAGALLRRALDFRRIFWVSVLSHVFGYGAVAIGLALAGFGVWSLVFGALFSPIVETGLLLAMVRHPVRPRLRRDEIREITGLGAGFSLGEILGFGARNGDKLVIGRFLGEGSLGLYGRAYALIRMPAEYVGEVLYAVLFPAFSEVQKDRRRLTSAYLRSTELALIVAGPVLAGMVVAAPELVVGLFGPAWQGSVVPLQVLAVVGVLSMGYPVSTNVANAQGRVYAVSLRTGVFLVAILVLGFLATPWGIVGVSAAVTAAHGIMYVLMSGLALRSLGLSWGRFGRAHLPGLVLALEVAAAALLVRWGLVRADLPDLAVLAALVATCALTLWAGFRTLPVSVRPDELIESLRQGLPPLSPRLRSLVDALLGPGGVADPAPPRTGRRGGSLLP